MHPRYLEWVFLLVLLPSVILLMIMYVPISTVAQTPSEEKTDTVSVTESVQIIPPGAAILNVVNDERDYDAVEQVSTIINTKGPQGATVTLRSLQTHETSSGQLPSSSMQCILGKIIKLETTGLINNFDIRIYFDKKEFSRYDISTLRIFYFDPDAKAWVDQTTLIQGNDASGKFVRTTEAPDIENIAGGSTEYFCLGGVLR